jgi:hypothetical protein
MCKTSIAPLKGQDYGHRKRTSPKHILVKTLNIQNKKRKLKVAREKHQVTNKGKSIRIIADFSTETLKGGDME